MKKPLTKDITSFDKKMKLRLDKDTILSIAKAVCVAVIIFIIVSRRNYIAGLFCGVVMALAMILYQLGRVDGIPLKRFIGASIARINPHNYKKQYEYTDGERLSIPYTTGGSDEKKKKR